MACNDMSEGLAGTDSELIASISPYFYEVLQMKTSGAGIVWLVIVSSTFSISPTKIRTLGVIVCFYKLAILILVPKQYKHLRVW